MLPDGARSLTVSSAAMLRNNRSPAACVMVMLAPAVADASTPSMSRTSGAATVPMLPVPAVTTRFPFAVVVVTCGPTPLAMMLPGAMSRTSPAAFTLLSVMSPTTFCRMAEPVVAVACTAPSAVIKIGDTWAIRRKASAVMPVGNCPSLVNWKGAVAPVEVRPW